MKLLLQAIVALEKLILWIDQKWRERTDEQIKEEIGAAIEQARTKKDTSALEAILREK